MDNDVTYTSFNLHGMNYHATCIENDIACKIFSTSHVKDDIAYIKIGVT